MCLYETNDERGKQRIDLYVCNEYSTTIVGIIIGMQANSHNTDTYKDEQ